MQTLVAVGAVRSEQMMKNISHRGRTERACGRQRPEGKVSIFLKLQESVYLGVDLVNLAKGVHRLEVDGALDDLVHLRSGRLEDIAQVDEALTLCDKKKVSIARKKPPHTKGATHRL